MKQYSLRTAIIHWVVFLLILAAFFIGYQLDEGNDPAGKLSLYPVHFLLGNAILLLVLLRIYFRKKEGEPAPANANPMLNKLAAAIHYGLNISVLGIVVTGFVTVAQSGVIQALKTGDASLVPDFSTVGAKEAHELFIAVALVLAAVHVVAAVYHQLVLKDNVMRRIMIKRFKD